MYFLPRRDLNFMDCELNRAIRYNGKEAEYVSFKLPRKGGSWNPELYPPAPAQEFSMTFEEWSAGQNKPPVLAEFDPESVNKKSDSASKRASVFRKKVLGEIKPQNVSKFEPEESKQISSGSPQPVNSNTSNPDDKIQISKLSQ